MVMKMDGERSERSGPADLRQWRQNQNGDVEGGKPLYTISRRRNIFWISSSGILYIVAGTRLGILRRRWTFRIRSCRDVLGDV
jgi:hypothetical protein